MMFRTVWRERPGIVPTEVVPLMGLAAQEATQVPRPAAPGGPPRALPLPPAPAVVFPAPPGSGRPGADDADTTAKPPPPRTSTAAVTMAARRPLFMVAGGSVFDR